MQYLLGKLTAAEEADLEQRYFADDALFKRLCEVETELVDAYVRRELDEVDRKLFEGHFLKSPRGKEKLDFALNLHRLASEQSAVSAAIYEKKPARSAWSLYFRLRLLLAAAALLCVSVLIVWQIRTERPRIQGAGQVKPPAPDYVPPPKTGEKEAEVLVATLVLGLTRDAGGGNRIQVPAGTRWLRLRLQLKTGFAREYRAIVTTVVGKQILETARVAQIGDSTLEIELAAEALPSDDYFITLSYKSADGTYEEVADCYFRLVWEK